MTKLDDEQSEGAPGDLAPDAPPVESGSKVDPGLESLSKYGNQVENFFGMCNHLPELLKTDLRSVANLTERTDRAAAEIIREQGDILNRAKGQIREATRPDMLVGVIDEDELERVRAKRRKVEADMDEEVVIAKRMYDILDNAIKDVDDEIFLLEKSAEEHYGAPINHKLLEQHSTPEPAEATGNSASGTGGNMRTDTTMSEAENGSVAVDGVGSSGEEAAGEEAVGPEEPVYCICRREGYGAMIGCDNDDCEHGEWFHYECVGLEKQVNGFWLCPGCSRDPELKKVLLGQYQDRVEAQRAGSNDNAVKVARKKRRRSGGSSNSDESDDMDDSEDEDSEDESDEEGSDGDGGEQDDEVLQDPSPGTRTASGMVQSPGIEMGGNPYITPHTNGHSGAGETGVTSFCAQNAQGQEHGVTSDNTATGTTPQEPTTGASDSAKWTRPSWVLDESGPGSGAGEQVLVSAGIDAVPSPVSTLTAAKGQEVSEISVEEPLTGSDVPILPAPTSPSVDLSPAESDSHGGNTVFLATDVRSATSALSIEPRLPDPVVEYHPENSSLRGIVAGSTNVPCDAPQPTVTAGPTSESPNEEMPRVLPERRARERSESPHRKRSRLSDGSVLATNPITSVYTSPVEPSGPLDVLGIQPAAQDGIPPLRIAAGHGAPHSEISSRGDTLVVNPMAVRDNAMEVESFVLDQDPSNVQQVTVEGDSPESVSVLLDGHAPDVGPSPSDGGMPGVALVATDVVAGPDDLGGHAPDVGPSPSDGGMPGVAIAAMGAVAGPDDQGGHAPDVGPSPSDGGMPGVALVAMGAVAGPDDLGGHAPDVGPSPSDGGMLSVAIMATGAVAGPDDQGGHAWSVGPSPSDGGMLGVAPVAMDAVAGPDDQGGHAWSVGPSPSGGGMPDVAPVATGAVAGPDDQVGDV